MNIDAAKAWLDAARDDLRTMELIVQDPALAHIAAFHAQQAVEKSLKALLEYEGKEVPKIHQIARLQALVDKNLQLDTDTVYLLDNLYIEARYPGALWQADLCGCEALYGVCPKDLYGRM